MEYLQDDNPYLPDYQKKAIQLPVDTLSNFLVELVNTCDPCKACETVGITMLQVNQRLVFDEAFKKAYDLASDCVREKVEAVLIDRAINGATDTEWSDGEVKYKKKHDPRYVEMLLTAIWPERYKRRGTGVGTQAGNSISLNIMGDLLPNNSPQEKSVEIEGT